MTLVYYTSLILFMVVCATLCFVIFIQESKGGGLGAAFGGDAGASVFGTSTADVLKKFTAYLATFFFVGCILLSLWTSAVGRSQSKAAPAIEQSE
jgi:preprotein translocase subunit SecG